MFIPLAHGGYGRGMGGGGSAAGARCSPPCNLYLKAINFSRISESTIVLST